MDQPAKRMEQEPAVTTRETCHKPLHGTAETECFVGKKHAQVNRGVKQHMLRELKAQGFSPDAIARLLRLRT